MLRLNLEVYRQAVAILGPAIRAVDDVDTVDGTCYWVQAGDSVADIAKAPVGRKWKDYRIERERWDNSSHHLWLFFTFGRTTFPDTIRLGAASSNAQPVRKSRVPKNLIHSQPLPIP